MRRTDRPDAHIAGLAAALRVSIAVEQVSREYPRVVLAYTSGAFARIDHVHALVRKNYFRDLMMLRQQRRIRQADLPYADDHNPHMARLCRHFVS